ncbi:ATP-binding cassette domain-containing protein [Candidatus Saccharibacteria bacterium]|nr:ATP-binding cassette domain-containing protein [Candidatus Saccharibacteria bacterium]
MLQVKGVSFKGILKGISFDVRPGELVVITGPNGSGKSTLAKIIAGVEKSDAGEIIFKDEDIVKKDCTERARMGLAFSFQQPVRFKGLTVRDLLKIAASGSEAFLDNEMKEVDGYLKKVGLEPALYLDREVNASLSGGELKRIEIASVLARDAVLSIFDEPEAGIDIWSFDNLVKMFKDMRKKNPKRAIVIISHQERIMKIADRIILLENGEISAHGTPEQMMARIGGGLK